MLWFLHTDVSCNLNTRRHSFYYLIYRIFCRKFSILLRYYLVLTAALAILAVLTGSLAVLAIITGSLAVLAILTGGLAVLTVLTGSLAVLAVLTGRFTTALLGGIQIKAVELDCGVNTARPRCIRINITQRR